MNNGAGDLLDAAAALLGGHRSPGWQRAVAVLTRQAVETAIDDVWRATELGMTAASWRSKLTALPEYSDREVALIAGSLWGALSNACHVRQYELPPTASELAEWLMAARSVVARLQPNVRALR